MEVAPVCRMGGSCLLSVPSNPLASGECGCGPCDSSWVLLQPAAHPRRHPFALLTADLCQQAEQTRLAAAPGVQKNRLLTRVSVSGGGGGFAIGVMD
jgi:hypothetical protein